MTEETLLDETQDNETVLVHFISYENDSNVGVECDDGEPAVPDHDELTKFDEVRRLNRDTVEQHEFGSEIVEPGDIMWREEFRELDVGEATRL